VIFYATISNFQAMLQFGPPQPLVPALTVAQQQQLLAAAAAAGIGWQWPLPQGLPLPPTFDAAQPQPQQQPSMPKITYMSFLLISMIYIKYFYYL
jgi:hypothetical protein